MGSVKLKEDHGSGVFEVNATIVGQLCVHLEPFEGAIHYRVSHAASLFAMPGYYLSHDAAMAAAIEIDAMTDWDMIAWAISPIYASNAEKMAYSHLGDAVLEVAISHGAVCEQ